MTAGEVAAIIVAIAVAILAVGMLFAMFSLIATLRRLRATVDDFRTEALPLLSDMRATVGQANAELARVDGILDSAESISGTVDSASRIAYLFLANPAVKALAFGSGTARAYRRLRKGR